MSETLSAKNIIENCWNICCSYRGTRFQQCKWCGQQKHAKDCPIPVLVASELLLEEADTKLRYFEALTGVVPSFTTLPQTKEDPFQKRPCILCHAEGWCKHMSGAEGWDHP